MSDDSLLRELTRVAREDQELERARLDERWDELAAGRLSPEDEEELRAWAESSPEEAAAYEAFRPLGEDFHARVTEAARFQLGRGARPAPARGAEAPAGSKVVDARHRWRRWSLPAAALAAASLLLFLWPDRGPAPLPAYGLELGGEVRTLRSETAEPAAGRKVFVAGNRLRLVLTPSVAVDGPVAARAFVLAAGGASPLAAPPAAISDQGAVRIEGEVGAEVRLPEGDVVLLVAVGRRGALPDAGELQARLASTDQVRTDQWSAWKVPLAFEDQLEP